MLRSTNLTPWPWKSIGFQTLLRTMYVPSLVKIHWRMLILECSQGCYAVKIWPGDIDLWPWKSIGFQNLLRTKYVPSLVKIHWRMLILECSQGCYTVNNLPSDLDLWPWKSIGFQTLLRTKYVPSLVKIHWRMLILECSQGCYAVKIWPGDLDLWPMTLKINAILYIVTGNKLQIFIEIHDYLGYYWQCCFLWILPGSLLHFDDVSVHIIQIRVTILNTFFLSPRQRSCEGI